MRKVEYNILGRFGDNGEISTKKVKGYIFRIHGELFGVSKEGKTCWNVTELKSGCLMPYSYGKRILDAVEATCKEDVERMKKARPSVIEQYTKRGIVFPINDVESYQDINVLVKPIWN